MQMFRACSGGFFRAAALLAAVRPLGAPCLGLAASVEVAGFGAPWTLCSAPVANSVGRGNWENGLPTDLPHAGPLLKTTGSPRPPASCGANAPPGGAQAGTTHQSAPGIDAVSLLWSRGPAGWSSSGLHRGRT